MSDGGVTPRRYEWRRLLPLALIALGLVAFFLLGLERYATFDMLRHHRIEIVDWVGDHPVLAPLLFVAAYALAVALSLPIATLISLAGGFLFGLVLGVLWVVLGATLGATAVFLAARTALGDILRERAGPLLRRVEAGFRDNAFSYMLFLRLVPLFPFWLVNLAPAFVGVPLGTYVAATFIGIIPGAIVFVNVGRGLGAILDRGEEFSVDSVLTPDMILALALLGLLALAPAVYRKVRARRL